MRHRRSLSLLLAVVFGTPSLAAAGSVETRELTFEQRFSAQAAIEQVYWSHRIWPAENHSVKPPLSAVMPADAIRAKVADYVKKSNALAETWDRAITAEELQAEMERMARDTRKSEILREIFEALGNDPFVIAECLARPNVTDRLLRDAYARDERFHGDLRRQAEQALARDGSIDGLKSGAGEYREVTWKLVREPSAGRAVPGEPENGLIDEQWDGMLRDLRRRFGSAERMDLQPNLHPQALPLREWTRLQQSDDSFSVMAVMAQGKDFVRLATVTWPKTSLDAWWHERRSGYRADLTPATGSYSRVAPRDGDCTDDSWTPAPAKQPTPAQLHTAVWTGTEMIVWGGFNAGSGYYNNGTYLNSGARYNPSTDTYTPTSTGPNVPEGRSAHTAVWTGTEMIIWAGYAGGSSVLSTGGRYNSSTDSWSSTSTLASPAPRNRHSAAWTGSEMIVWGGNDAVAYFDTGGRYDPSSDTWTATSVGTNVPSARAAHTAVWTGSVMVIWGGIGLGPAPITGGRYDPTNDTWLTTSTSVNLPAARLDATAVWTGTVMIVWGGQGPGALSSGGRYNPATNAWSTMSVSPAARYWHTAVWTGTHMVIWGGSNSNSTLRTGSRYNPATNTWSATSGSAGVPSARYGHTAVWTGTEMIVWGGSDDHASLNSGGRYNPLTTVWTPTRFLQPDARLGATSVWTGTEMIVWGGQTDVNLPGLNTGGRYDPATDTFAPTEPTFAPSARAGHTAVWTGSEMIVWGGGNPQAGTQLNSGGRYSPSTDSWVDTSLGTNAPEGRSGHSAVWTGSEMIVWGGASLTTPTEITGGRYNPLTDSWTPVSTTGAPAGRRDHTSVWIGSAMIVWGGADGSGAYFNTGGRYDPIADTWLATSTGTNVPDARHWHTAVWTGSRMIVWGGGFYDSSPNYSSTGGRYDPSADAWEPTSTGANVPTPRAGHTAIWTGTEMIVWGGEYFTMENTGGRYEPLTDSWMPTSTGTDVPSFRSGHVAVWTGTEMIVWSGYPSVTDGSQYCAICATTTWYRDADGDGYGEGTDVVFGCAQQAGYVAVAGDCNDASSASHPGAVEICDGLDNDCDTSTDNVALPGTIADVLESKTAGVVTIAWTSPLGAQLHDVVRGQLGSLRATGGDFTASTTDCLANDVAGTSANDPDTPAAGAGFWHLVRASNCGGTSTYDGATPDQSGVRDAEIAASGAACP